MSLLSTITIWKRNANVRPVRVINGTGWRAVAALILAAFFVAASLWALVPTASAQSGYAGVIASMEPGSVTLASGEAQEVRLRVKNTGTETWYRAGDTYLSAYTWEPKYHVSPYRGPAWRSDHQVGTLMETQVAPGETGTFALTVYGPPNFTGNLTQVFRLAAEDTAWLDGGVFTVRMEVVDGVVTPVPDVVEQESDTSETVSTDGYGAQVLIRSTKQVVARANETVTYRVGLKNTGVQTWNSYELRSADTALAASGSTSFEHPSWTGEGVALARADREVAPGRLEMMTFDFRAPHRSGTYTAQFQLVADGVAVPGGVVDIPVEVTSNAPAMLDRFDSEDEEAAAEGPVFTGEMIEEPRVRVGIDRPEEEVIFTATDSVTVVESDVGYERYVMPDVQTMRVRYNFENYVFSSGEILHLADRYLRFEGEDVDTIFTVTTFTDIRSWNTSLNDNRFRDTLEIRYNTKKDRTWLINELPMEYYLYGVDETSNTAPVEYHKALATAARTYALYAWEHKAKYAGEYIDLRSTTYDQVYHGYGAEIRRPNWIEQVQATEGITIQYEGETIIAAYFSRSDGHTRDWADVWGRDVPYAVGVPVPCEAGSTMWGHGVGMSALGAVCMAEDEGKTFDEILHHFYTGIELFDRW